MLVTPEDSLRAWIGAADSAGLQVAVHAIGERANGLLLDIYDSVARAHGAARPPVPHRARPAPAAARTSAASPAAASSPRCSPTTRSTTGAGPRSASAPSGSRRRYAFRSLLDRHAHLAFGSDWTVAPLDPLLGIYAAVTRRTLDGKHPDGWVPEQKITVEEALRAYTAGNAYGVFAERTRGQLAPGYMADLVLLDRDLTRHPPEDDRAGRRSGPRSWVAAWSIRRNSAVPAGTRSGPARRAILPGSFPAPRDRPSIPESDGHTHLRPPRASAKLEKADLLDLYRIMLLARRIDDKEIQLKRQNKIFFQISGAGHEAVLAAASQGLPSRLRLVLHLLPRSRALSRPRHDGHRAAALRRRRGRRPQLRRPPDALALGAQGRSTSSARRAPPAPSSSRRWAAPRRGSGIRGSRGSPDRDELIQGDEVVLCTTGDGTTSEGEFWEALNTATNLKLPVVFLVEDNGYAISVPVEVNTPGRLDLQAPHRVSRACSFRRWTAATCSPRTTC